MKALWPAIFAAAVLAVPATAQSWAPPQNFWQGQPMDPIQRLHILQDRVAHGEANGTISPDQARQAHHEIDGTFRWINEQHYEDGGKLTPDQRAEVQRHIDHISQQINWERAHY